MKNQQGQSESALKRVKATKLDIVTLTANMQNNSHTMQRDLDECQQKILMLDEKIVTVDNAILSIDTNLDLCHRAVCAVKETLDVQTRELTAHFQDGRKEHEERYSALDIRITALTEDHRSSAEKQAHREGAAALRIAALEERIPPIETELKALGEHLGAIETLQGKINARIIAVMRMSLAMTGVLVITLGVLGWIVFRH